MHLVSMAHTNKATFVVIAFSRHAAVHTAHSQCKLGDEPCIYLPHHEPDSVTTIIIVTIKSGADR
jgi:hypothetical protein